MACTLKIKARQGAVKIQYNGVEIRFFFHRLKCCYALLFSELNSWEKHGDGPRLLFRRWQSAVELLFAVSSLDGFVVSLEMSSRAPQGAHFIITDRSPANNDRIILKETCTNHISIANLEYFTTLKKKINNMTIIYKTVFEFNKSRNTK